MSDSLRFKMPLLDAAQVQKHVTINEALLRADVLGSRRVESRSLSAPPASPVDGTAYIVGNSATDAWAGTDGEIAIYLNGGWVFIAPWNGLQMWVEDEGYTTVYHADTWIHDAMSASTWPGPTEGSWSMSPTMRRAA